MPRQNNNASDAIWICQNVDPPRQKSRPVNVDLMSELLHESSDLWGIEQHENIYSNAVAPRKFLMRAIWKWSGGISSLGNRSPRDKFGLWRSQFVLSNRVSDLSQRDLIRLLPKFGGFSVVTKFQRSPRSNSARIPPVFSLLSGFFSTIPSRTTTTYLASFYPPSLAGYFWFYIVRICVSLALAGPCARVSPDQQGPPKWRIQTERSQSVTVLRFISGLLVARRISLIQCQNLNTVQQRCHREDKLEAEMLNPPVLEASGDAGIRKISEIARGLEPTRRMGG
jgi:hypothetical protein